MATGKTVNLLRCIEIDVNGSENLGKFPWNEQLWDIVTANIKYVQADSPELYGHEEIDWVATKKGFMPKGGGHCVYFTHSVGYQSIVEFEKVYFNTKWLAELSCSGYVSRLSEILMDVAVKYGIKWHPEIPHKGDMKLSERDFNLLYGHLKPRMSHIKWG